MLDIIVTHYNEPWRTGRKFFDMLGCQRGIKFSDIHVILVHDGTDAFPDEYFQRYPYTVQQYTIPHGGVSAARNYGLDKATDTWIEFCDFDDMYIHAYALKQILSVMDQDVDYMWMPFYAEYVIDDKLYVKQQDENVVWIHGKYFRRQWLIDNNLRFPEGIHYSEDSAFCAIVNAVVKPDRRGKIHTEFPIYSWTYRPDSISTDPKNIVSNTSGFIDRNFYVVEEMQRRGIPHQLMVGRMFADAYCAFHRDGISLPAEEWWFAINALKYLDDLHKNSTGDMLKVFAAARRTFRDGQLAQSEPFDLWMKRIYGE